MFSALFLIGIVIVVAYVAVSRYPRRTERLFGIFWTARGVVFAAFWLILGLFAIANGPLPLVAFGMAIWLIAALYYLLDDSPEVLP